ncbi:MAG: hypothetical protein ACFFDR_01270 [Candidatus Thorarchaeota archaeon]
MSYEHLIGTEAEAQVKVTISGAHSDTPNLFVWDRTELIAKIWLYPDGRIKYRSFVPKTTQEIEIRGRHLKVYDPRENL